MFFLNNIINTERLLLRPHTMNDVHASYEMNLDPEVSKYTGDGGVVSLEEIERRICEDVLGDYQKHGYGRWVVEHAETSRFMGFCGLKYLEDLKATDLGYRLKSEFWGKGYATEAAKASIQYGFDTLGLNQIIAMAVPDNPASINVLHKLGFTFQKQLLEDGELVNFYRILKSSL